MAAEFPKLFRRAAATHGLAAMLLAALFLNGMVRVAVAQGTSPYTPYQHRAWYIYLIAQYTEWPKDAFADDSAPFVIGIVGEDPFGKDLDVIKTRKIRNRPLTVRYLKATDDLTACHVLYVCNSERNSLSKILRAVNQRPALTIGELDGFFQDSGIVKFWQEKKSRTEAFLRFEINLAAAEKARLRIHSQVLKLAKPEQDAD